MGAILSKFWPNKSSNNNNQPQLAIAGPPPRLPLPSPPPRPPPVTSTVDKATAAGEEKSTNHGRKPSKKHQQQQQQQYKQQSEHQQLQQQQSVQQFEKPPGKNVLPLSNQSFIYKTVFEATVSDANANEEEARINAAEAPGPFEIETDLLSPEIEEAVIKIQANVRGYLTRKQYRGVTPDRSVETSQQQPTPNVETESQEPVIPSTNQPKSSSGILAPPPSFSDTPKEFPLDHDDNQIAANQGKEITEKLIEFSKQVNQQQAINQQSESTPTTDDVIVSKRVENVNCGKTEFQQSLVDCVGAELKSTCENNHYEYISAHHPLEVPSIETSGPEEAAIKIQAAFRGYQVRKTISRETSPCHTREGGEDGAGGVHLREKDFNSNQDSERESILVLNQLEECLSQELMRSSIHLEDEASLSSYSTDLDLNASLQSNTSLMALISSSSSSSTAKPSHDEENCDLKLVSIGSNDLLETETITNNQPEKTTIDDNDEPSITTTIPDTIKSESVNNEQIVDLSPSESPLISTINQVPIVDSTANRPVNQSVDCLPSTSSKEEDKIKTIKTEPVLFVASDEKVNAIEETVLVDDSLKNDQEIDPVIIVEVNGKLDASSNISKSNDQPINELKSIELESTKESETLKTETKSESKQLIDDTTKFQVDCESTTSLINETTSSTHLNQSTEEIEEPEIEPLFFDMISPLPGSTVDNLSNQQIVTDNNPVNVPEKFEQITSSIPDVQSSSSSLPKTVDNDQQSDLNQSISAIDGSALDSQQKVNKLIKEDSFGSDILLLEDDKSDTLYDPFADDLTTPISSCVNQQQSKISGDDDDQQLTTSSTFVDDNLIKSVVDDINRDEGLLLYETNSKSINDNQTINQPVELPDENITEVKDDILVNLDESDEEDDDSQKRPVDESINSNSTIRINIQRPSDAQEIEQLFQERSRDLGNSVKIVQSDEQSTGQSTEDNNISNGIISPSQQSESQSEATIKQSSNVSQISDEVIQKSSNLESEKSSKFENVNSPSIVESVQQSTINHDNSSIESEQISINPFLNQPDFDSDIESGKINLNDQSLDDSSGGQSTSSSETIEQPSKEKESTITSQQLESKVPKMEIVNNKDEEKSLEKIVPEESSSVKENNQSKSESLIVVETADLKSTIINEPKDAELPMKQKDENNSSTSSPEIQQLKPLTQDSLKETLIVTETESSNQSTVDEKLIPLESSTDSSASSSTANQPAVIIEPIDIGIEQKVPTINESSVSDEPESRLEEEGDDSSPSDLLLRLQDRETRSKSPNPFGRRKRRPRKNRGGANN